MEHHKLYEHVWYLASKIKNDYRMIISGKDKIDGI